MNSPRITFARSADSKEVKTKNDAIVEKNNQQGQKKVN